MIFRAFLAAMPGAQEIGNWNTRLSTITTETGDLANGAVISAIEDLTPAGDDLEASSTLRPVIDSTTTPGGRLVSFDGTDRLASPITDTAQTIVMLFYIPASPAARVLAVRDTSASTTKAAFSVGFSA